MNTIVALVLSLMGETMLTTDYADGSQRDLWLRHPVYGDPSFDAFVRAPGNPILRGAPPFEWPVNGFLFDDPVSKNWYVYVGRYAKGYAINEDKRSMCTLFRSTDRGKTWEEVGPIFPPEPFTFAGDASPVGSAPDVSVVYDAGRYHLVYDYATANSTWATIANPSGGADNGIGYAWAERPEGPFTRTPEPVYRTSAHPLYRGKYRRAYAQTLIRRRNDWLVLAMMDSGPHYSWALVGMTAQQPEGPYSEPAFLRCVDDAYFHPPLLEFYPAFTHDAYIYAPATSVASNRNFQCVFRVPIEEAMRPDAWELFQYGSVWHSEDIEDEYYGLWGQTFSGFVGADGLLHAMFPTRDISSLGTINLAYRPWDQPYLDRGFTMTGHAGASLTLLTRAYETFDLDAEFTLRGTASILWAYNAPLGPDAPKADATLHPLTRTRCCAVELAPEAWQIVEVDAAGQRNVRASGVGGSNGACRVSLKCGADGQVRLALNDAAVWDGPMPITRGALGLRVEPNSHLNVARFAVTGASEPGALIYLYTEAVLGAGAANDVWRTVESPQFRYGPGPVSQTPDARAKWNVEGTAFTLWAPRAPDWGKADLLVDGTRLTTIDYHADEVTPSAPLFTQDNLKPGFHAIVLQTVEGIVPLDVIETR